MTDLPIVCTLSPEALKARRENLLDALLQRSIERTELIEKQRPRLTDLAGTIIAIAGALVIVGFSSR